MDVLHPHPTDEDIEIYAAEVDRLLKARYGVAWSEIADDSALRTEAGQMTADEFVDWIADHHGLLDENGIGEVANEVIEFHADDMRDWKAQLKGRTLDHWKAMVEAYSNSLLPSQLERVATACWHRAEA